MFNAAKLQRLFSLSRLTKTSRKYALQSVTAKSSGEDEVLFNEHYLDQLEANAIVRQHKNNVPRIRQLIAELTNQPDNSNLRHELQQEIQQLPNTTHPRLIDYGTTPKEMEVYKTGKELDNPKEFSEICKRLNLLRMENLGNYTGHKSYYLMGDLALLDLAIIRYALAALKKHQFRCISVPDILPKSIIEGCGMKTDGDRNQVYKLNTGKCLSGTSEMALAGFFKDRIFEEHELPMKVAAVSRCYRAETSGLHEEKGIYRVHQFTKVEMFAVCTESQSEQQLESFKDIEIALFQKLGIDFRVLDMPPFELGAPAYQKYDIEAWMPGRKMWGEISSCSNCTDYQSKRLNIKYRSGDKLKLAHTVNGTAAAIPRLLIALIEAGQSGRDAAAITMPEVLQTYLKKTTICKDKRMPEVKLVKFIKSRPH